VSQSTVAEKLSRWPASKSMENDWGTSPWIDCADDQAFTARMIKSRRLLETVPIVLASKDKPRR
jgi:hypothetical protein